MSSRSTGSNRWIPEIMYEEVEDGLTSKIPFIQVPIEENSEYAFETTIGQLNFFKWVLENKIIDYIEEHYDEIQNDMDENNSLSKTRKNKAEDNDKTRKKREELSINAIKTFKKEKVEVIVSFD